MSYYYNYYNNYAQPAYNAGYNPQVVSGLNMLNNYEKQSKTKSSYIGAIVILVLFLIGAIVAVIVLYFTLKPGEAPPGSMNVGLTATRTDISFSSEYADETQNAFQSLATTTCYTITTVASADNYIITECSVNSMSASATQGIDMSVQITVFLDDKTEEAILSGLATSLSTGVEDPLIIDSSSVQKV